MRIIPAIDIIDGKCVRLEKGNYQTQKTYHSNPLEMAKEMQDNGIQYLHLVDLDGARSKKIVNINVLEKICSQTQLKVDFGGGIKSENDIRIAFECGVQQITLGSVAVSNPDLVLSSLDKYGSEKIILGADAKDRKIATLGWEKSSEIEVGNFITEFVRKGIQYCISTDIEKDGMLAGPSIELYKEILQENPTLKLIASGGVTNIDDIRKLKEIKCEGAIIGKALYEGNLSLNDLKEFL